MYPELLRSVLLDLPSIIAATTCHQRNYVERYSRFTRAAEFQFRAKGMPGHPSVVLPHPISNLTTADMQALTQRYVEQVVRHLTA